MISLQTKGIFTELLESDSKKSAFEMFLKSEYINVNVFKGNSEIAINRNKIFKDYTGYKDEYNEIFNDKANLEVFHKMRLLEILILQSRSILNTSVKLGLINQKRGGSETSYVIARSPFYNPDNVKAEIRVYLGKASEINRPIEELSRDLLFMEEAERQIVKAMNEVVERTKEKIGIKKSVKTRVVVMSNGERVEEVIQETSDNNKKKHPLSPGKFPKQNPKSYL